MKVFISQPMSNETHEDIKKVRSGIMEYARAKYGDDVREIASYLGPNATFDPLESLGLAIQMMNKADVVIFAPGWEKSRGCMVEHMCATMYKKEAIEVYFDGRKYMTLLR